MERITFEPHEFQAVDISRYITTICELGILTDPYACVQGIVAVIDLGRASLQHLPMLQMNVVKELLAYTEKALPIRTKGVFLINCQPFMEQILKTIMACLSQKIRSRVSFYCCD